MHFDIARGIEFGKYSSFSPSAFHRLAEMFRSGTVAQWLFKFWSSNFTCRIEINKLYSTGNIEGNR